jgi:MFS family permease
VALVLLGGFLVREATARTPLIPLRIFRSRNISGANLIQVVSVAGMFGMFFMGSLYMQRVLGYDALEIGLAFLPGTVIMGILSLGYSHKLVMRFGARQVMLPAFVLIVLSLALFTQAPVDGGYVTHLLPTMVLFGIGGGLGFPALMTISMSDVEPSDAGLVSGLVNTTAQVGGALGLAVLATLATTRTGHLAAGGDALPAALTGGYHLAFTIGAGLMVVAIAIGVFVVRPAQGATAGAMPDAAPAVPEHAAPEPVYSEVS